MVRGYNYGGELHHYGVLGMKWGVRKTKPGYSSIKGNRAYAINEKTKKRVRAGEAYEKNLQDAKQHERMGMLAEKVNSLQKDKRHPLQVKIIQNPSWTTGSKNRYLYEITQPDRLKTAAYESNYSRTFTEDEYQQLVSHMGGEDGDYKEFEKEVDDYLKDLNKRRRKASIRNGKIYAKNYLRKFGRETKKTLGKFVENGKSLVNKLLNKIKSLFD